jgi:predicted transposase/invertase (TIGR01784 family)
METDAFFCQLFKQLPQTLFHLIDLPAARAKSYRFDSVELKKSFRIDGLFLPKRSTLPLYFVEVQFQRVQTFYANLFAKVFCYLHENDPKQDWVAVAIFASRAEEPKYLGPYEDLLRSKRVKRIYLDELATFKNPPVGLGVLQLLFAPMSEVENLAPRVVRKAKLEMPDGDLQAKVVELVEELLISRFPQLGREEIRMKFKLHDLRESKVWKEAHDEGEEKGMEKGKLIAKQEMIQSFLAEGMNPKRIAELLKITVEEVQRLSNAHPH